MLVSVKWLREMTPYQGDDESLADRLTMLGLEMEEFVRPFEAIADVVVGHVITCEKHPEADKLSVTTVDVGDEALLDIVCGAPNVAAGQKVAVAKVGTTLPNGLTLKKAKIRGQASHGMICAEDELGLGEDHAGIMVLPPETPVGKRLVDVLDLDETVFDLGITPNRADCLSILGVAKEVGMAYGLPVTLPETTLSALVDDALEPAETRMAIDIPEPTLCPVYRGRVIEGVTVGRAPGWMRYRLLAHGVRPISNIVDVTNYVLFEMGQPLHSFDLDLLQGGVIRVARADEGMRFTTLDDQERVLTRDDLLIWDGGRPVGLAGVMGGANTEVHAGSTRIFLESAVFRPASIRRTARRLAIPSEASYRFERGVDQPGSLIALNRATALMAELGGGRVAPGVAEAEPQPWRDCEIPFRPERARSLLGVPDLDDAFCRRTCMDMGCQVETPGDAHTPWRVTAPSRRLDLEREVDLVEEVGRVWGMDRIPLKSPHMAKSLESPVLADTEFGFLSRLKHWGRGVGLAEVVNYSFVGERDLDRLLLPAEGRVPVANPLTEEQNVLRTALAPGLLFDLKVNMAQHAERLRLVETARVFRHEPEAKTTTREEGRLGLLLTGPRHREGWPFDRERHDYTDCKGLVTHLLATLGLPEADYIMTQAEDGWAAEHANYLEPCVTVRVQGELLGVVGMVRADIADEYDARAEVWLAELDTDLLMRRALAIAPACKELPRFPASRRDITLAAPAGVQVGAVLAAFRGAGSKLMADVQLQDIFEPEGDSDSEAQGAAEGVRNLTFRLTFRHQEKTLKDKDVDKEMARLVKTVADALPVTV